MDIPKSNEKGRYLNIKERRPPGEVSTQDLFLCRRKVAPKIRQAEPPMYLRQVLKMLLKKRA